jgi:hypothetical protein
MSNMLRKVGRKINGRMRARGRHKSHGSPYYMCHRCGKNVVTVVGIHGEDVCETCAFGKRP